MAKKSIVRRRGRPSAIASHLDDLPTQIRKYIAEPNCLFKNQVNATKKKEKRNLIPALLMSNQPAASKRLLEVLNNNRKGRIDKQYLYEILLIFILISGFNKVFHL